MPKAMIRTNLLIAAILIFRVSSVCIAFGQRPDPAVQRIQATGSADSAARQSIDASSSGWEGVPPAMARVKSFRAHFINALDDSDAEILVEVSMPDRFHFVIPGQAEGIGFGAHFYIKAGDQPWAKESESQAASINFKEILSSMFEDVQSAKLVGAEALDGVATNVFEAVSTRRGGAGTIKERVWVGKSDSLIRKIEQAADRGPAKAVLICDYNTEISIKEPSIDLVKD